MIEQCQRHEDAIVEIRKDVAYVRGQVDVLVARTEPRRRISAKRIGAFLGGAVVAGMAAWGVVSSFLQ